MIIAEIILSAAERTDHTGRAARIARTYRRLREMEIREAYGPDAARWSNAVRQVESKILRLYG